MKQIFTVEIHETWVKKTKVIAETRNDALAKAKADFISTVKESIDPYIAHDPEAECIAPDFKLEWPDGNPKEIKDNVNE